MKSSLTQPSRLFFYLVVAAMLSAMTLLLLEGMAYADTGHPRASHAANDTAAFPPSKSVTPVKATSSAVAASPSTPAGVATCAACHGMAGQGNAAVGYPRLAGLPAAYLEQQLAHFADGSRNNPMMTPIAKTLGADDQKALAAFYASLPVPAPAPESATSASAPDAPGHAARTVGEHLALEGDEKEGVPACVLCHGHAGSGIGDAFPALAGQSSAYLRNQMAAWKHGTRAPGPLGLMASIANKLSDNEIGAVADYFAALDPTSKGKMQ